MARRETRAGKRARAAEILDRLERAYPDTQISLGFGTRFQLLVAVILSAQTTDVTVDKVTPALFRRYPTPGALAAADPREVESLIRPTGYYRAKTRNIIACARALVDRHGGRVPERMGDLVELPGVGRKTANVVLWNAFGRTEGIAVDTHVARISRLLGLTGKRAPERIEADLMALVPQDQWGRLTHLLIDHGRAICIARRPRCERCPVNDLCPGALRPPENDGR